MNNDFRINIPMAREQREIFDKMTSAVSDSAIKTVSFKLFDTLVLLPFSENNDIIFTMMSEYVEINTSKHTFSDLRIEAEAEAKRRNTGKCSVTISEIYTILAKKAKISDDVRDSLIKRECELVERLAFPRAFGKKLLDTAVGKGKNIVIIADTIYPRETVLAVMEKCGISGKLLISNEIDSGENRNDSIFGTILKKGKASPSAHIHIGGDIAADVETPILKGAKALLLADVRANMIKSGRIRGFVQSERIFDYDSADYLGLHMALGIYSAYIFDIPRNKAVQSDFCGNAYILGFIVYGCCKIADITLFSDTEREVFNAIAENDEMRRGGEDFLELYRRHSADIAGKLNNKGFELPLKLLTAHGGAMDVGLLKGNMEKNAHNTWKEAITDAPAAPKFDRITEQNRHEKFADKLFPPGTKVRNIADGMLFQMKKRKK